MEENLFQRAAILVGALTIFSLAPTTPGYSGNDYQVEFSREFIENPDVLAVGEEIWLQQCSRCHGKRAYPGKAPKLEPSRYKIGFVYKRVTKGFRGMPPWEDAFNEEERKSVSAYIMSPDFEE
jgi:mono/diheme cytochrome c family protein